MILLMKVITYNSMHDKAFEIGFFLNFILEHIYRMKPHAHTSYIVDFTSIL